MDSNNLNNGNGEQTSDMNNDGRTNLIINYLPQTLQDDEFFKLFCEIGPIKSSRIVRDNQTGYSYGFGFIEYQTTDAAAKAISQLNNLPVAHKRIKVSYARPPGENIKETNLYIQNIPKHYTDDQLEDLFSKYGNIVQKNILKNRANGESKGVGFVRYDKKDEAQTAISQMNGYIPPGENIQLNVRLAEEHGKQKAAYYAGKSKSDMGYQLPPMQMGSFGRGRGFNAGYNDMSGFSMQPYGKPGFNNMPGKLPPFRPNKRFNPLRPDFESLDYPAPQNMGGSQFKQNYYGSFNS